MPPRAFDAGEGAMRIAADIADLVETLRRADKRILLLAPAPPAADGCGAKDGLAPGEDGLAPGEA